MSAASVLTDIADAEPSIALPVAERRPPAVLQVVPRLVTGGVERGTVDLAAALVAQGWRAVVASEGGPMVRELERAGALHVTLPLAAKNPLVMRANVGRLAAVIERNGIDIVHARSRAPAWSALAAARRTETHFVTTFHNAYGAKSWLKRRYNSVMARGERVIAISDFVAAHVAATYGVGPDRLRTVHRGIDLARFDPERVGSERVIDLARQWGLPDGVPVVMLPGRLARWKGQDVLLEALRRLGRSALHCVIVGGGSAGWRRALADELARRPPPCPVALHEDCRDMAAAYMLADVVVSASTEPEGFGRVIVEAQAMGRPVIATAHGGAAETVVAGETGWLVPPGDAEALAAALGEALALDPAARAALAARAMAHVRARFATAHMTGRTIAIYEELLAADAARSAARSVAAA
ncbi:MAG TPA: glycosyltransferase family 4 protein [Stellaceae bacterium]|nr:glycosyltransferase family 4 protein [Stellaceae bacterium]